MTIKIEVAKVRRGCKAYKEGDVLLFRDQKIIFEDKQKSGCASANCTIFANIGRLLYQNPIFISCLDAGITAEGTGNVIFKITLEE